jgi:EF-P beta-lysylation protein EpmB
MKSLSDAPPVVRPGTADFPDTDDWRQDLQEAIRCPLKLCEALCLPRALGAKAAEHGFRTLAPLPFVKRMRWGDPNDPLLRQVLPTADEGVALELPLDAVGDLPSQRAPGLLQKYRGRSLLMLGASCAVNCRYCFRRHFPYEEVGLSDAVLDQAIVQIASDNTLTEVILSGGDPLIVSDAKLRRLVAALDSVPHLRRLRIHSRLPVVLPARVTPSLCEALQESRLSVVVVLHINHAREIDAEVSKAVRRLRNTGAMLLNQSVLLRGVNDSFEALRDLSETLVDVGVTPYYLHQLDVVAGVSHFEVEVERGRELHEQLRAALPGYAVPRYVREVAGEPYKTILA